MFLICNLIEIHPVVRQLEYADGRTKRQTLLVKDAFVSSTFRKQRAKLANNWSID